MKINGFLRKKMDLKRICFIHLPKCGGTSVWRAIEDKYDPKESARLNAIAATSAAELLSIDYLEYRKKLLVYFLSQRNLRYISGHFPCDEDILDAFTPEWHFITILRHPVDRWFSNYFYNRYKRSDHFKTNLPIEQFIDSHKGVEFGQSYLKFLSGGKTTFNNSPEVL